MKMDKISVVQEDLRHMSMLSAFASVYVFIYLFLGYPWLCFECSFDLL